MSPQQEADLLLQEYQRDRRERDRRRFEKLVDDFFASPQQAYDNTLAQVAREMAE